MLITNHVLAGAVIGVTIKEPSLAIVVAFTSHFVMDMLPHFGYPGRKGYPEALRHKLSYIVGAVTFISTLGIIFFLITKHQWFPLICGFIAASPDIVGWYNYVAYEKHGRSATGILNLFQVQFHRRIQKFERPWCIYIEIVLAIILLLIVISI